MSITVIDTNNRRKESSAAGTVRQIITSDDGAKGVRAAIHEIEPGLCAHITDAVIDQDWRLTATGGDYFAALCARSAEMCLVRRKGSRFSS